MDNVLRQKPLGLLFDLDGTISDIAQTPDTAFLYPGISELLKRFCQYAQVAIISGRTVADSASMVQVEGIIYIGCHGLEWVDGLPSKNKTIIVPEAMPYIQPGKDMLKKAEQYFLGDSAIIIERKSVGGAIHYRLSRNPSEARERILSFLKQPDNKKYMDLLHVSEGKMVIEIQPPLSMTKGYAIRKLKEKYKLRGVIFAGDDQTDQDGFIEMRRLKTENVATYSILVGYHDTVPVLYQYVDRVVQGVSEMSSLLSAILNFLEQHRSISTP